MKHYFAQHSNGNITVSSHPIKETGAESYSFEVNEADLEAVKEGTKDWEISNGRLSTKASTRKAEKEVQLLAKTQEAEIAKTRKKELIKNITDGKATKEEQEEFANLI